MLATVWFVCALAVSVPAVTVAASCVEPPPECPNDNITFWLYTSSTQDNPHQLTVSDDKSFENAPFVKDRPIKILIHGYTGHKDFSPNTEIRPAYFEHGEYNVISVDYNPIAREPCYIQAAHNTQLVGNCTAQLIDCMVRDHGYPLSQFHVIGFSLGGQTAGFISNYLQSGQLDRVTGLDPALPLFVTTDNKKKLDAGDAKFVDVLHTNALEKGKLEQSGHTDFYANGGLTQPGCFNQPNMTKSGCDHARAPQYYAESITTDVGFYGTRCFSWITYMIGWCEMTNTAEEFLFGEFCPNTTEGLYFFRTNSRSPYARGKRDGKEHFNDEEQVDEQTGEQSDKQTEEQTTQQSDNDSESTLASEAKLEEIIGNSIDKEYQF